MARNHHTDWNYEVLEFLETDVLPRSCGLSIRMQIRKLGAGNFTAFAFALVCGVATGAVSVQGKKLSRIRENIHTAACHRKSPAADIPERHSPYPSDFIAVPIDQILNHHFAGFLFQICNLLFCHIFFIVCFSGQRNSHQFCISR